MSTDDANRGRLIPPEAASATYDGTGKSPQEIEEDIVETREQLGEILDELERRIAPRQLLERGFDMLKDTMSGDGGGVGEAMRTYPVPLALIGMGLGWILMSNTARDRLSHYGSTAKDRVAGAMQGASERVGGIAGQVRGKVSSAARAGSSGSSHSSGSPYSTDMAGYAYARQKSGQAMEQARQAASGATGTVQATVGRAQEASRRALDRAGGYASQASGQLYRARDRFTDLVEDHPIALGAMSFLAGAVFALMLPRSRTEERLVGPMGDDLREQAAGVGREAVERTQQVAERAVGAVKEAINQPGGPSSSGSSSHVASGMSQAGSGSASPMGSGPAGGSAGAGGSSKAEEQQKARIAEGMSDSGKKPL